MDQPPRGGPGQRAGRTSRHELGRDLVVERTTSQPTRRSTPSPHRAPRLRRRLAPAALLAMVGCGLLVHEDDRPLRPEELGRAHLDGEVLMARANCLACHRADAATTERIAPLAAPDLGGIGWRASPGWLRRWLDEPHGLRAGSRMPDLLGGLEPDKRADVSEKLVHFLMTLGGGYRTPAVRTDAWDSERGAELFDALGCRACHEDGVDGDLPAKTDLPTLSAFLRDPLRHRPAGAMPDMDLAEHEARALASWLLRDQLAAGPSDTVFGPGLELDAFELAEWPETMPELDGLPPAASHSVTTIDASRRPREDEYALRFRGEVFVAEAGDVAFWTRSDDGSLLWIGDELVVDNDGHHGPVTVRGSLELEAGWHPLRVEMFEAGGGDEVGAGFVVDDREVPFGATDLRHRVTRYAPRGHAGDELPDPSLVWRGRAQFRVRRCISCHDVPGVDGWGSLDLAELDDLTAGCLADHVEEGVPDYHFDEAERAALRRTLADRRVLREPLTPEQSVDHALARLDCLACHSRDGRGGLDPRIAEAVPETIDLGDEGRLPPDLTRVGARLRPEWIASVLEDGASVRPYLSLRMPRFGADAVAPLVVGLPVADGSFAAPPEPAPGTEALVAGRTLAGNRGMACIACHTVAGHEGTGLPALDLATTPERLTWPGFHRWMSDPIGVRPGTRMPTYFEDGESVVDHVLDGDAEAQIGALWSYLGTGRNMVLPEGLVVERSSYDQIPVDRPVVVSVFMEGLSGRVIAVGHPERVHHAYDAEHVRMARLWAGDFLNLEGTWRGRAGDLERPAGHSPRDLPPGPAFARAGTTDWPTTGGPQDGWRHRGQQRWESGLPSFQYRGEGVLVSEWIVPVLHADGPRVRRMFQLDGDAAVEHVLRAALAEGIEDAGDAVFVTDDGLTLRVVHGEARLVDGPDGVELRVAPVPKPPPTSPHDGVEVPRDGLMIELEMSW